MARTKGKWAQLHADWYLDDDIEAAADAEPIALYIWPVLIGMAKKFGNESDNPTGEIKTTIKKLREVLRLKVKRADARVLNALDTLVDAGKISYTVSRLGILRITLNKYRDWQTNPDNGQATAGKQVGNRRQTPGQQGGNGGATRGKHPGNAPATEGHFAGKNPNNGTKSLAHVHGGARATVIEIGDIEIGEVEIPPLTSPTEIEEKTFVDEVTAKLTNDATTEGQARAHAESLLWKSRAPWKDRGLFPLSQWMAAVDQALAIDANNRANGKRSGGNLRGLIFTLVPDVNLDEWKPATPAKTVDEMTVEERVAYYESLCA